MSNVPRDLTPGVIVSSPPYVGGKRVFTVGEVHRIREISLCRPNGWCYHQSDLRTKHGAMQPAARKKGCLLKVGIPATSVNSTQTCFQSLIRVRGGVSPSHN